MFRVIIFAVASLGLLSTSALSFGADRDTPYIAPPIPMMLNSEIERREYMVNNYWRDFDFGDTSTISTRVAEDAFVRYITYVLNGSPLDLSRKGIVDMIERSSIDSEMFENFVLLTEKYLYDPNSIYRNDELYIPVLEYIIASPNVDKWNKVRPEHQLRMAKKNRVATVATDFAITISSGKQYRLSQIDSEFTIVFFNNPDCADCHRVKGYIVNNSNIFEKASIVSVYIDSDLELWRKTSYPDSWINGYDKGCEITKGEMYDLKAIPTIYLLDKDKRVILKDAPIELVAQWLRLFRQNSPE